MKYLILAGGSGTRLWPLSRKKMPKQFLNLTDPDMSMLNLTADRVTKENGKDVFVISNEKSKNLINKQLKKKFKKYGKNNFIPEPIGRNTAPAIAYSTLFFKKDDIIAVLSSDHYIKDGNRFNDILNEAALIAEKDYIVTIGIKPDFPSTGYGYIKKSKKKNGSGFLVEKFVEKPDEKRAKKYLSEKTYFWNAGIFIFKAGFFLEELKKYSPDIYAVLEELRSKKDSGKKITINDFMNFKSISIDYALMEKSKKIVVLPGDMGWSDIGSFQALYEVLSKDENGNVLRSDSDKIINVDSGKSMVFDKTDKRIVLIGCENIGIINTDDALLITDLSKTEKVKDVVEILKKNNGPEL